MSCGYASNDEGSRVDEMWQNLCNFNGILKDESRWEEEFKMLEEPDDHPNFRGMLAKISMFMTMPEHFVDKCPTLKKYMVNLLKYHASNEKIVQRVKTALDYLAKKQLLDATK